MDHNDHLACKIAIASNRILFDEELPMFSRLVLVNYHTSPSSETFLTFVTITEIGFLYKNFLKVIRKKQLQIEKSNKRKSHLICR